MHDREPTAAVTLETPQASNPEPSTDTADALMAASLNGRWEFVEVTDPWDTKKLIRASLKKGATR